MFFLVVACGTRIKIEIKKRMVFNESIKYQTDTGNNTKMVPPTYDLLYCQIQIIIYPR